MDVVVHTTVHNVHGDVSGRSLRVDVTHTNGLTDVSIVNVCVVVSYPLTTKGCVSYFFLVKVMHVIVSIVDFKIVGTLLVCVYYNG